MAQRFKAKTLISNSGIFYKELIAGTGIFNGLELNNIDNLSLSGVDITITSGVVALTNRPTVNGTGVLLSGEVDLSSTVRTTGAQTVSGVKTFATGIDIINSGNPQNLRVFNKTGTNTGEFGIFGWNNNQLTIGAQQTNSGILRDVILTGTNININPISGSVTTNGSGIFSLSGALASGLPNNPLSVVGSGNTYIQLNIQNRATGTNASADLVITANNGTDSSNYINLGINNSGYNDGGFTNGTGFDGYLFIDGGNLDIGTKTSGRFIEFHAGGTNQNNTIARITESGFNILSGNVTYPVYSGATGLIFIPDASISTFFDYTLTGNSTLNQPINMNNGQSITLFLTQDASGNRNMSFNSGYLFSNGINPTLNLIPSGTDIMQVIKTRNKLYCTFASNY